MITIIRIVVEYTLMTRYIKCTLSSKVRNGVYQDVPTLRVIVVNQPPLYSESLQFSLERLDSELGSRSTQVFWVGDETVG